MTGEFQPEDTPVPVPPAQPEKRGLGLIRAIVAIFIVLLWGWLNVQAARNVDFIVAWPVHLAFGVVLATLFPEGAKVIRGWLKKNGNGSS